MFITEERRRFVATFHGSTTASEIESLWEMLGNGVGVGLIDFSASTGFVDCQAIERIVRRAKAIPASRLAFICHNDLAFGSVRLLTQICDLKATYNIFRQRENAVAWLDMGDSPRLVA